MKLMVGLLSLISSIAWAKVTVAKKLPHLEEDKDLTFLGITIEKSTLLDAIKLLGDADVLKTGDASASSNSVCYIGHDGTAIVFNSGQMGAKEKEVTDIQILKSGDKLERKCRQSSEIDRNISSKRGLRLGLTEQQVIDIFGPPRGKRKADVLEYSYSRNITLPQKCVGGKWDVSEWVTLKFSKGALDSIQIFKTTSC